MFTPREAKGSRADARRVQRLVTTWASAFCDGWETFRPDPAWGPGRL